MRQVSTSLTFEANQQSVWRPGYATNFRIDTGDLMIWDPDEISKEFGVEFLGFGLSAEAYLDVRFGLLAFADLGTGGSFDVKYDIDLFINKPDAIFAGSNIAFDFTRVDVTSATVGSVGFGNSLADGDRVGAGLDLIIEIEAGLRNVEFEHWFGSETSDGFKLIDLDHTINLIGVDLDDPELTIEKGAFSFTARLPRGANVEGSSQSAVVAGDGVSDVRFLELNVDLDQLLTDLLEKIPLPPVKAIAKVLSETVFAEHEFDLNDYIPFIPKDKFEFNFTLLDIGAGAGLNITEDVIVDITGDNNTTPEIRVTLLSDNGTPGDTRDDVSRTGIIGDKVSGSHLELNFTGPTPGGLTEVGNVGDITFSAVYELVEAKVTHLVGLAATASLTIDALQGQLAGSWVPEALRFSFGPLLSLEFPEDGFAVKLGDLFEDSFIMDMDEFNTETAEYSVFFASSDVAPSGWNPALVGARDAVYGYFEDVQENVDAAIDDFGLAGFVTEGENVNDAPDYDFSSQANTQFIWTGGFDATDVVLREAANDQSHSVIVDSTGGTTGLRGGLLNQPGSGSLGDYNSNANFVNIAWASMALPDSVLLYFLNGKEFNSEQSASVVGGDGSDLLLMYKDEGRFFDGKGQLSGEWDRFIADFSATHGNLAVNWDLRDAVTLDDPNDSSQKQGITLFTEDSDLDNDVTIRHVESIAIRTGGGDDFIRTWEAPDYVVTQGGSDFIAVTADSSQDIIDTGGNGDLILNEIRDNSFSTNSDNFGFSTADEISGGTGFDQAFHFRDVSKADGNHINILSFTLAGGTLFDDTGRQGAGHDASHSDLSSLLAAHKGALSALNGGTGSLATQTALYNTSATIVFSSGESFSTHKVEYGFDIEEINFSDDAFNSVANDLVMYLGGSYYGGGGGVDTFVADFEHYEEIKGDKGGLYLAGNVGGLQFGELVVESFERFHVLGTSASDVLIGGSSDDFLIGNDGDDYLFGGTDSAADFIAGGFGSDTFYYSSGGSDTFDGGLNYADDDSLDTLIISSFSVFDGVTQLATRGMRYDFYDASGADTHSNVFFFASDSTTVLLDGLAQHKAALANTDTNNPIYQGFNHTAGVLSGDFARFVDIDITQVYASDDFDDLIFYQGDLITQYDSNGDGTLDLSYAQGSSVYAAGERANDADAFVADFSLQNVGIEWIILDDDARSLLLENGVRVQGVDRLIVELGSGDDTVSGARLDDYIDGGDGEDNLYGGAGTNILKGGTGEDSFAWMAQGSDTIDGGADFDSLLIANATGGNTVNLTDDNGAFLFTDAVDADATREQLDAILQNSLSTVRFVQTSDGQTIDYSNVESVSQTGVADADDLIIYRNGAAYSGGDGTGTDVFVADLSAATDNLVLDSQALTGYDIGNGVVIGGFERFHTFLGRGDDLVIGSDGDDLLFGGDGNDKLFGGLGTNYIDGGNGNDVFQHIGANETILGGSGTDELTISTTAATTLNIYANTVPGTLLGSYSNSDPVAPLTRNDMNDLKDDLADYRKIGVEYGDVLLEYSSIERVYFEGSEENDLLIDSNGGVLRGYGGNDILVNIGANNPVLLDGGSGADTYVFMNDFIREATIRDDGAQTTTIHFMEVASTDLVFSNDGIDLIITAPNLPVTDFDIRFLNFFENSNVGKSLIITTTDQPSGFTKDLTSLNAGGAAPEAGTTEYGTGADEEFFGTAFADEFFAGAGDDFINSSAGADLLVGGGGEDVVSYADSDAAVMLSLFTGEASGGYADGDILIDIESIAGSQFDDHIFGSDENNTIGGGRGDDLITGGEGQDFLFGGQGNDEIGGGAREDSVFGDEGDDQLNGNSGNDYLSGGDGSDILDGGDDDDVLDDGAGNDSAFGGSGDDTFVYSAGFDTWDGGDDVDTASFDEIDTAIEFDFAVDSIIRTRNDLDLSAPVTDRVNLVDASNIETFIGTIGNDEMRGGDADENFYGGLGNDTFTGRDGSDVFIGGDGQDTVDYSQETGMTGLDFFLREADDPQSQFTTVTDTYGNQDQLNDIENIRGSKQDDEIYGNSLSNILHGDDGADRVVGGAGDDFIFGGAGNDASANFSGAYLDGGEGDDFVDGGEGDDKVYGFSGNDRLMGGAGNDEVFGEQGNDIVFGGAGIDILYGGDANVDTGIDTVSYELVGATGNGVTIDYRAATVFATGLDIGTDQLYGFENTIGSQANDTVIGSDSSAETYSYFEGFDTFDGNGGSDTISFQQFHSAIQIDQSILVGGAFYGQSRDKSDLVSGGTLRNLVAVTDVENIIGSDFDDIITTDAVGLSTVLGGKGDDIIAATGAASGANQLSGGEGSDRFVELTGVNFVDGGAGIDWLDLSGSATSVTANLTTGLGEDDTLVSVENLRGADALGGQDFLTGNELDNVIVGGLGVNVIYTGGGDDVVIYSGGFDAYRGEQGSDTIDLSTFESSIVVDLSLLELFNSSFVKTNDSDSYLNGAATRNIATLESVENIIGTSQDDFIAGTIGANMLGGGLGDDKIYANAGDDIVSYSGGNDTLFGQAGNDTISFATFGASVDVDFTLAASLRAQSAGVAIAELHTFENIVGTMFGDRIRGDNDDNILVGLGGNDLFISSFGNDSYDGGDGLDTLDLSSASGALNVDLNTRSEQTLFGTTVATVVNIENIIGTAFDDVVSANNEDNVFDLGFGEDIITAFKGDDTLIHRGGISRFDGGGGGDTADFSNYTAAGILAFYDEDSDIGYTVYNNGTDSALIADLARTENITGTNNNDQIWGSELQNELYGMGGDDELIGSASADVMDGGSGNDWALYNGILSVREGVKISLLDATASGGFAQGDVLTGIENVVGTNLADVIVGDDNDNVIGGGTTSLTAEDGRDDLKGAGGNDVMYGGNEVGAGDLLAGGAGNDMLFGEDGDDRLFGEDGNDLLYGGDGRDFLVGNAGDDLLDGGAGNDNLRGREGNDRLYGLDGSDYMQGDSGDDLLVGNNGNDLLDGGDGNDRLEGRAGDDRIYGLADDDLMFGGDGDDLIIGNDGNDIAYGDEGNDNIRGRDGDDQLFGGGGNDYIKGGAGNDRIDGGDRFDTLFGDGGNDVFVFSGNWRFDKIADFENTLDMIDMSATAANSFADLTLTQQGNDLFVNITGDTFNGITIFNVNTSFITSSDFMF